MTEQYGIVRKSLKRCVAMITSPLVILIVIALFLICFSRFNGIERKGNSFLFRLTSPLIQTDGITNRFVIVRLPKTVLAESKKDIRAYENLTTLLKKNNAFGAAGSVVISDHLEIAENTSLKKVVRWVKAHIEETYRETTIPHELAADLKQSEAAVFAGEHLTKLMTESGVIQSVLLPQAQAAGKAVRAPYIFQGKRNDIIVADKWDGVYGYLPKAAKPLGIPTIQLLPGAGIPLWRVSPYSADTQKCIRNTLWQQEDAFISDLTISLCELITGGTAEFIPGQGIRFDDILIKTGPYYNVIPHLLNDSTTGVSPALYDYEYLLKSDDATVKDLIKGRVVIVTGHDTTAARSIAQTCTSLLNGAVSHIPGYAWPAEKIGLVLILLYLIGVVRKVRYGTSFVISLLIVITLLVFQAGAHIVRGLWFPVFTPVLFLVTGHLFMYFILKRRSVLDALALDASSAYRELGEWLLDASQYDKAFTALSRCTPDKTTLELLYKTGSAFERKGMYNRAKDVFVHIKGVQSGYRDTAQRVKNLSGLLYGRTIKTTPSGLEETSGALSGGIHSVLGRYEVDKEIGKGSMGTVYLANDPKIGRQVAVKTLDLTRTFDGESDSFKDRFLKEARAAGKLNHPSIVTIYDYGEEQNLAFITMDYIQGKTLSDYISEKKLLPVSDVYAIIENVAEALHYAHGEGIVHRDIKPGNIMYDPVTKVIKITDFGIARMADTHATKTGVILGTPSYMAPEQLRGQAVDGRTDVFSLGVTLYQLLTGALPFSGDDLATLAYCITSEKHTPVNKIRPELPDSAVRITDKALSKKPDKRYKTAGSLAKILRTEIEALNIGTQLNKKNGR